MTEIDTAAFEAGEALCIFSQSHLSAAGSSTTAHFSGTLGRVYLEAHAELLSARPQAGAGQPALTVLVEDSADGSSWVTVATFEFAASGQDAAAVDSPRRYLRTSWAGVSGTWSFGVEAKPSPAATAGGALPAGGSTGQVLTKASDADGDADWEASGGGSMPTDEVVQFTQIPGGEPSFPIVAVDLDVCYFAIDGDQRAHFPLNAGDFQVTGSTGNDNFYNIAGGVTYDADSDTTRISPGPAGVIVDGTADGDLIAPLVYTAEIVIPPNGAVEWVEVLTDEEWTGPGGVTAYWTMGDDDDPYAFTGNSGADGSLGISSVGLWQWPINTLHTAAEHPPLVPEGNLDGYKLYPDGTTIRIVASVDPGVVSGSTRFVVHHHFTEPVTPTRLPAA